MSKGKKGRKGSLGKDTVNTTPKVSMDTKTPIFIKGQKIPKDIPFAYIISKDGFFMMKRTSLYVATVKVDSIPAEECKESCTLAWDFPRIPYSLLQQAHDFFGHVYAEHQAEAIVLLLLEEGEWKIHPPKQRVGGASVNYENDIRECDCKGMFVGTIHSHCNMGAFYSGTDDRDDSQIDGIHIVLGKVGRPTPEMVMCVAVNGIRFRLKPEDVIDNLPSEAKEMAKDHPWMDKVTTGYANGYNTYRQGFGNGLWQDIDHHNTKGTNTSSNKVEHLTVYQMNMQELRMEVTRLRGVNAGLENKATTLKNRITVLETQATAKNTRVEGLEKTILAMSQDDAAKPAQDNPDAHLHEGTELEL